MLVCCGIRGHLVRAMTMTSSSDGGGLQQQQYGAGAWRPPTSLTSGPHDRQQLAWLRGPADAIQDCLDRAPLAAPKRHTVGQARPLQAHGLHAGVAGQGRRGAQAAIQARAAGWGEVG